VSRIELRTVIKVAEIEVVYGSTYEEEDGVARAIHAHAASVIEYLARAGLSSAGYPVQHGPDS